MSKIHIFDHPLIQHKLSILRDEGTCTKEFRELVNEISMLMCFEATRDLLTAEVDVQTPVGLAKCRVVDKKVVLVPILRAGLGMVDGMLSLIPNAKVGHIGLYRDEETLEPVEYYCKLPVEAAESDVIVVDPMLATGGSASAAIGFLKNKYGCKNVRLMSIVAAPIGAQRVAQDHPDVDIYVAAMDDGLNDRGYIVPGLGDAGDRIFGTK